MKTLADRRVLDATVLRFSALGSDRRAGWGVMTATQMVAHLDDAVRMSVGDLAVKPRLLPLTPLFRLAVLRSGILWAKNLPTIGELDRRYQSDVPEQFTITRDRLIKRMCAFSALAPKALQSAHPMLGPMSHWEWMRWGYLHTDHHLRQFGC